MSLCLELRVSREAAMDMNTEPSQNEQIVWDDPTARQERAKLADNLQWPGSPSQRCQAALPPPPPAAEDESHFRDLMTDSELVEMGMASNATQNWFSETNQYHNVCVCCWNCEQVSQCVMVPSAGLRRYARD